ncbi:MAG TPA: hypothetical protein VNC21_09305 [Vicinamibacterales bacterium]|nr:hypothetical protein [Vicinamibacterales bacterium]
MNSSPAATGPTRRQWIFLCCLFVLSLPAVTPRIYSSDEIQYFAYLRSIWFDGDLSFDNEYRYFYDRGISRSAGFHETFLERTTETGRRINFGTIGCAILWAPFYAVGDLAARATGAPADGFSPPYIAAIAIGSAVYGFLALVLAILCARLLDRHGFRPALAIWMGTPLIFYMYVAPPFSHACSAFGVALFTCVWLRVRDTWSPRGMMALGAAGALMAMIREQDAFFVAGPAVDFVLWAFSGPKPKAQSLKPKAQGLIAAAMAFVLVFTPQAVTYLILNGHLGPHSSVGHKMNWRATHALQVLFSPEHGLFVWTPVALLALAGIVCLLAASGPRPDAPVPSSDPVATAFRRKRHAAIALLVMVALQIYIGGSVESWTVAGAFGQRRFVALTCAMVIGYAALDEVARSWSRSARNILTGITVVFIYWNLALIAEFSIGLMDRQRLEPAKNAYDAFVTLPRMAPSLAYRYLFERGSFYKRKEP